MLQSVSGVGIDAARVSGDAPVHQLSLCFDRERFQVKRQDAPWKVVRAFAIPQSGALVHLHNVSGGVLAGDRLRLDVEVMPGAAAQITTAGATRLYRHRAGAQDSQQSSRFVVGDGGLLEYLPDIVIPFAGSRHGQRSEFHLGRGATLFWWESVAPGRLAAGERFAFDRLHVQSEVKAGGRAILREDYVLEPGRRDLSAIVRMAEYSYTASLCAVQQGRPASFWRGLEERLNEVARARTRLGEAVWGVSMLARDGVVVRGLCKSGCFINRTLMEFWTIARLEVTGTRAVPPRKIY